MTLKSEAGLFRHDLLPRYTARTRRDTSLCSDSTFCIANGIQGALVKVDQETGRKIVASLGCGRLWKSR